MKMSTRSRYGLKVCQILAEQYNKNEAVSLPNVSNTLNLSESYLEQLMILLKKDNIVRSVRGANGGYYLSRPPKDITVGEVLRTLEGGFEFVDCLKSKCEDGSVCKTKGIWKKLYDGMNGILDSMTLQDVIEEEI